MSTYTHYVLQGMKAGELMTGMYTESDKAESAEVAWLLAKPRCGQDSVALVRVETRDALSPNGEGYRAQVRRVIIEIME